MERPPRAAGASRAGAVPERLLAMSTGPGGPTPREGFGPRETPCMLLSFERPTSSGRVEPASAGARVSLEGASADLENCTALPTETGITVPVALRPADHRQDRKGTRWMPRHQESMKGVNGCDKPREGAE